MWSQLPLPKKGTAPIFGPCVLWPDGCMDQDATWHGNRSLPRPHYARWGTISPPQNGRSPQFSAHICCGQMAKRIKMPLDMQVGLIPSDIVLDGDPAPLPQKGAEPPIFSPCLLRPRSPISATAELLLLMRPTLFPLPQTALVGVVSKPPPQKAVLGAPESEQRCLPGTNFPLRCCMYMFKFLAFCL